MVNKDKEALEEQFDAEGIKEPTSSKETSRY